MQRRDTVYIVTGCASVLAAIFLAWNWARPPVPKAWEAISPGMSRETIREKITDLETNMFEIKGIDSANAENRLPWYPRGFWHLGIVYSQDGKAKHVGIHYINRDCGLFNATRTSK